LLIFHHLLKKKFLVNHLKNKKSPFKNDIREEGKWLIYLYVEKTTDAVIIPQETDLRIISAEQF